MLKKTLGFTLIELLISVSILTILSGAVIKILNSSGVQAKARDSQRISDLKKIQVALELYFSDNRKYPSQTVWRAIDGSADDTLTSAIKPNYLSQVPKDPVSTNTADSPCSTNPLPAYTYKSAAGGVAYILTATMEVETSDDKSPCSLLPNWNTFGGCTVPAGNFCYGLQNP